MNEKFQSATAIAERVVAAVDGSAPLEALPTIRNLAGAGNWHRRKVRPHEPKNLDFELDFAQIPDDFFQGDVVVDIARHVILATPAMLQLLSQAKRWYVDGIFKVNRKSFVQLLSIHAFVQKDRALKHTPFCFILMSKRRKRDYSAVFDEVRDLLPENIKLREIVSDFEAAILRTTRHVFGQTSHRGCLFHWSQAIWQHIQELGMARNYIIDDAVHRFCRLIMALPFLPHDRIADEFERLEGLAKGPELVLLTDYVRSTWIESTMWRLHRGPAWAKASEPTTTASLGIRGSTEYPGGLSESTASPSACTRRRRFAPSTFISSLRKKCYASRESLPT